MDAAVDRQRIVTGLAVLCVTLLALSEKTGGIRTGVDLESHLGMSCKANDTEKVRCSGGRRHAEEGAKGAHCEAF